jgi:sortase A
VAAVKRGLVALLLALGVYSSGQGLWIFGKAIVAQVLLRHAWDEARSGEDQARPWPWADTWPVARLLSPNHDIDLIVLEGASGESTAFGPGRIAGTARPGDAGTLAIAGHRDTHFEFLEHVAPGEPLYLELPSGSVLAFEVDSAQVVDEGDTRVLGASGDWLTLVTCYPFHTATPGGPLRYVVRARRMAHTPLT